MHSTVAYVLAAVFGVLLAHYISRAPELRAMRLSQLVLVPVAMVVCAYFLPEPGESGAASMGRLPGFLFGLFILIVLLAPNIAHHCGAGFTNFLDPQDWTPEEEEISLRPIRRLIDNDKFAEALGELGKLLEKHKPTYEAVLIRAKLFHHVGNVNETVAALLKALELSHTTQQQLNIMELLALVDEYHQETPRSPNPGTRRVEIHHELILFPVSVDTNPPHKAIPPGAYQVTEFIHRNHRWLKLAEEDWANAEMCWEALAAVGRPDPVSRGKSILEPVARLHRAITAAIKGKSHRQSKAESVRLFGEANQCIRRGDWQSAAPLLQQASANDPDRYEIAYRWAQAASRTSDVHAAAKVIGQILQQSHWSESEQHMLEQLKRGG